MSKHPTTARLVTVTSRQRAALAAACRVGPEKIVAVYDNVMVRAASLDGTGAIRPTVEVVVARRSGTVRAVRFEGATVREVLDRLQPSTRPTARSAVA